MCSSVSDIPSPFRQHILSKIGGEAGFGITKKNGSGVFLKRERDRSFFEEYSGMNLKEITQIAGSK